MSYLDRLQTGSFRNVPFKIDTHTFDGGRRAVLHEFPERDDPYTEDLGRRGRTFAVEFHIIGTDYFGQRDAMIRALERKGFGILIHPYLGRKEVQVTNFSMTESIYEGRICKFSVTFLERGRPINPTGIFGSVFAVFDQVNELVQDLRSEFDAIMDVVNYPSFVLESFTDLAFETVDIFNEAIGIVPAAISEFNTVKGQISDFGNQITSIVSNPLDFFDSLTSTQQGMTTITDANSEKQQVLDYVISNIGVGGTYFETTPSRVQEKTNAELLFRTVKGLAIAQKVTWLTQAVTRPFDLTVTEMANLENDDVFSISDLERARDNVLLVFDQFIDDYGDFDSRQSFVSLRAKFVSAIDQAATSLQIKKKIDFQTKATLPALVVVYDKTEQIKFEEDFISRNKIRHPAFVSGGVDYEVVEF